MSLLETQSSVCNRERRLSKRCQALGITLTHCFVCEKKSDFPADSCRFQGVPFRSIYGRCMPHAMFMPLQDFALLNSPQTLAILPPYPFVHAATLSSIFHVSLNF